LRVEHVACSMFRISRSLKYFFAVILAGCFALAAAQFSFSETINSQPPVFVPIFNTVVHTNSSALLFSKLKSNSGTKRILIFSDYSQSKLAENSTALLRCKVKDPRLFTDWKWSQNWQRLSNTADGSCLIFKRPGKLATPEKNTTAQDYYEGWVSCHSTPGTKLRLICKATSDDFTILKTSQNIVSEYTAEPGKWVAFEWNADEKIQLTFRSSTSPEIGVLAAEPENGFSIWQLPAPDCATNSMREQSALLQPHIIILIAAADNAETLGSTVRKLFPEIPMLICCEEVNNNAAAATFNKFSTSDMALLLCTKNQNQTYRAAFLTRQIEQLAGI
jgi:hypothetical protein